MIWESKKTNDEEQIRERKRRYLDASTEQNNAFRISFPLGSDAYESASLPPISVSFLHIIDLQIEKYSK